MPFNPSLPAFNSPIVSEELRDQFNGLKDLIDENIPASEKGAADGVASLDSSGLLVEEVDWSHVANKPSLLLASDKGAANGVASLDSNSLLSQQVDWSKLVNAPSLVIATGIAGGQTIIGGTAAGNNLSLSSTSHATKGTVQVGTIAGNAVAIGNATGTVSITSSGFTINSLGVFARGGNYIDLASPNVTIAPFGAGLTIFDGISSCRSNASHSWQAIALTAGAVPWVCKGAASQTAPLLKCVDSASAEQFGIGPAGQIRTNQSANATTPGSVVKKLQVFDSTGNSLGYIPIYDAIT